MAASETSGALSRREIYRGRVFDVWAERVRLPHGPEVTLDVVRHRGSVILVPMPSATEVILVRQYRHAVGTWMWELPAGSLEPGEDPVAAAGRECHEETGFVPETIERLAAYYPTPGYCDELMIFFRLTDLRTATTRAAHDPDEHLEPRVFDVSTARQTLAAEPVVDMKTAIGLLLLESAARGR